MRLGIFGGTFDPVHYGHLLLGEYCREQCRLDEVWFVPAAVPPHKQGEELTPGEQRAEMLELAIGGHESLLVCRDEITHGGVSYTVDTLRRLASEEPKRELFLLLGADSLHDLPLWREPAEICRLAMPVVVRRPATDEPDFDGIAPFVSPERLERIREHLVAMPRIELSSSEIRRRVAAGLSVRYQTPRAVEKYIQTAGLYRSPPAEPPKSPSGPRRCAE